LFFRVTPARIAEQKSEMAAQDTCVLRVRDLFRVRQICIKVKIRAHKYL
jgi:hypothetical protein